jgi:hypothetical protein
VFLDATEGTPVVPNDVEMSEVGIAGKKDHGLISFDSSCFCGGSIASINAGPRCTSGHGWILPSCGGGSGA